MNSSKYSRDCINLNYYYEAIEVNLVQDGQYIFSMNSTYHFVVCVDVYQDEFNRFNPYMNELKTNVSKACAPAIKLSVYLQKRTTYILVVTTSSPNMTGSFSITTFGPSNATVTLKRLSE